MMVIRSGETEYVFDTITSFTDSFSKSVTTTPIVSLPTDCTFPLETAASLSYDVSFARISPKVYNDDSTDSNEWCNATWIERVSSLVNRWQMRTDGYAMEFRENDGNSLPNPYVPHRVERVYIKKLNFSYDQGYTDYVTGTIQLRVGSARTSSNVPLPYNGAFNIEKESDIEMQTSYLVLTAPDLSEQYMLQYGMTFDTGADYDTPQASVDCINSYTLTGGPNDPFESIQIRISRKKLTEMYPQLGEAADNTFSTDVLAGKSAVIYRGMGEGQMIVSNCKMSSDEYIITAYCKAEMFRGAYIPWDVNGTPKGCLEYLLYGNPSSLYRADDVVFHTMKDPSATISFKKGTTTFWQAMQICAGMLNAKIFFANSKVYVIDYSIPYTETEGAKITPNLYGELELYPESPQDSMYGRVVGTATYGNEGQDTIINVQTMTCGENDAGQTRTAGARDEPSIAMYAEKEGTPMDLSRHLVPNDTLVGVADGLCDHIVQYACEPQKSITFTVKEQASNGKGNAVWAPLFPICMCARRISSSVDGISLSNKSSTARDEERTQKLYLSSYSRQYPKMVTDYTFGVISSIDLQSTLSQISKR